MSTAVSSSTNPTGSSRRGRREQRLSQQHARNRRIAVVASGCAVVSLAVVAGASAAAELSVLTSAPALFWSWALVVFVCVVSVAVVVLLAPVSGCCWARAPKAVRPSASAERAMIFTV